MKKEFIDIFHEYFGQEYTESEFFYSNIESKILPSQGVKIHISAHIYNAEFILMDTLKYIQKEKINFKFIKNNRELKKFNDGIYGYSQTGKFITLYPTTYYELKKYINDLKLILERYKAPRIPYDFQIDNSIIYARYGIFISDTNYLIVNSLGEFIIDDRTRNNNLLFDIYPSLNEYNKRYSSQLLQDYIILKCIRQKSKGGVYLGLGISKKVEQTKVIIKEGRRYINQVNTEIDAASFIKNEYYLLSHLKNIFPETYTNLSILTDDYANYLIMNIIEGHNLLHTIKYSNCQYNPLCIIGNILKRLVQYHNNNIVLNDLSLDNIVINQSGEVEFIDFEYSYIKGNRQFIEENILKKFGTSGFYPIDSDNNRVEVSGYNKDIYAIGVIFYILVNPSWYLSLLNKKNEDDIKYWDRNITIHDKKIESFIKLCTNNYKNKMYKTDQILEIYKKMFQEK